MSEYGIGARDQRGGAGSELVGSNAAAPATAALATVAVAAVCWVVAIRQMRGMDMGAASELGSLSFFVGAWASMMAAMMLPGALPAVWRRVQAGARVAGVPMFAAAYIAVWTLVGLLVYAFYAPHRTSVAGALTVAAGLYELTPLKRACRRGCHGAVRSGFGFGLYCVGSSIGLMLVLLALGVMSITWMSVVAVLIIAQKLLAPRAAVDLPVALAIVGLGVIILVAPASVPGLTSGM